MTRNAPTVPATADERLRAPALRGSRTDWARVDSITDEELDALIAADPDDDGSPIDMDRVITGLPPLASPEPRLDPDVRAALPEDGEAMTRTVNAILRAHFARADAA